MYRKNIQSQSKVSLLLKQERKLFHTKDLALLWGIDNKNTLYTTIKRYCQKGILAPIHKGFYSTKELEKIDPVELGVSFLHQYAYLSCESILVRKGIISQDIPHITLVSGVSRKFCLAGHSYIVRSMKPKFLYQTTGVFWENGYFQANAARAAADLKYFNPFYHFDGKDLVDWRQVKKEVFQ